MATGFLDKFRRVTSSTGYLPEIDGLRFLAIFWVAIPMHALHYLDEKFYGHQLVRPGYWKDFVMEGTHGMYLFFMISGFILSLPFANAYLNKERGSIDLKHYYLRRLTRLEVPYITALLIFFFLHVFVVNKYPLSMLLPSLLASLVYLHDLIYVQHSYILPIAWSLEIEVQFYLLAPLFCMLFRIDNIKARRLILLIIIILGTRLHISGAQHTHVFRFIHYFFTGILLSDLYVTSKAKAEDSLFGFVIGILSLLALFAFLSNYTPTGLMIKLLIMFLLFHQVLFSQRFKQLFTLKGIAIIGGMCYSIYLLHFGIISAFGAWMLSRGVPLSNVNHAPLYLVLLTVLILLISGAYFYFIEKPFMKFNVRRWYRKAEKVPAE